MVIDPIIWMFIAFAAIMGLFFIIYIWVQYKNREKPVRTIGDLVSRSELDKDHSGKVTTISKDLPQDVCPVCESSVRNLKICKKCGYEIERCKICSKLIKLDDILVICPYCGEKFHREEFLEWLKIKARCPNCKSEMDLWEFRRGNKKKRT
ncbi:MAG: hypothetical protein HWN67_12010 [Candidatus Helarchaeota archaeon]|nr:hypothetical protein [Candidatus Helarchaeota archaeon]